MSGAPYFSSQRRMGHLPRSLLLHVGVDRTAGQPDAAHIDFEGLVPLLLRDFVERASGNLGEVGGVVDQNVDRAERVGCCDG